MLIFWKTIFQYFFPIFHHQYCKKKTGTHHQYCKKQTELTNLNRFSLRKASNIKQLKQISLLFILNSKRGKQKYIFLAIPFCDARYMVINLKSFEAVKNGIYQKTEILFFFSKFIELINQKQGRHSANSREHWSGALM